MSEIVPRGYVATSGLLAELMRAELLRSPEVVLFDRLVGRSSGHLMELSADAGVISLVT